MEDSKFQELIQSIDNNRMEKLIISEQFSSEQFKQLIIALKKNTSITSLYLRNNNIGSEGAKELAAVLKENYTITDVNLKNNRIEGEGARDIAEALKENKTITKLNLQYNNIGSEGAKAIAGALKINDTITEINLRHNNIGSEGAKAIAGALKDNKSITKLNLQGTGINDEGVRAIAGALKDNKSITILNLKWTGIKGEGARAIADALKENETITTIDLSSNNIGSEGAKAIAGALKINNTITEINLRGNNIGSEGAKAIAGALKDNKSITNISLSSNYIWNEGVIAIAAALKENNTITNIYLEHNLTEDAGKLAIAEALKKNFSILCVKGVSGKKITQYTERNQRMLDTAFEHAYEYFYNGNNVNIVNGKASPNPISIKDLSILEHHQQEVQSKLAERKITDFKNFMNKLKNYKRQNMLKLMGVSKGLNDETPFSKLPLEIIEQVMKHVEVSPSIIKELRQSEKQYFYFCTSVAEQSYENVKDNKAVKTLTVDAKSKLFNAIKESLQKDEGLKSAYFSSNCDLDNKLRTSLAQQISEAILETSSEYEKMLPIKKRASKQKLQNFDRLEEGQENFFKTLIHKIKKLLMKSYSKDRLVEDRKLYIKRRQENYDKLKTKTGSFVKEVLQERANRGQSQGNSQSK
ncbi:MAG: hypothetical protein K0Q51_1182 [Rickettsiaceae bacterium]|jgi:Ran GTPase-activating protein (RanGAP) involved in mRNA processing and transport|nr:hypothetical protein [Rickettsiaceae bacterium]